MANIFVANCTVKSILSFHLFINLFSFRNSFILIGLTVNLVPLETAQGKNTL